MRAFILSCLLFYQRHIFLAIQLLLESHHAEYKIHAQTFFLLVVFVFYARQQMTPVCHIRLEKHASH